MTGGREIKTDKRADATAWARVFGVVRIPSKKPSAAMAAIVYTATPGGPGPAGSRALGRPVRGEALSEVIGCGHGRRQRMGGQSWEMAGMLGRCDMGPSAPSSSSLALVAVLSPQALSSRPRRAASNARTMRGVIVGPAEIVPQRLLLGFSWGPLGYKDKKRPRWGPRGRWCRACKATPFVGSLATIFSSGCRQMTGCFPRSSHLAVHGRQRGGEVSELARLGRDDSEARGCLPDGKFSDHLGRSAPGLVLVLVTGPDEYP